jgi:cysteine-rich repeat protein
VCVPAFHLPILPVDDGTATAYTAPVVSVMDHSGGFYTGCCDTRITAFTGETATRDAAAVFCEEPPDFPSCLFAFCLCGYRHPAGAPFTATGTYASPFGPEYLYYDGHAGYDFSYAAGRLLVATADGVLCKALHDPVNGMAAAPTAWDAFHTFYVDHGSAGGVGWASWYLHAAALAPPWSLLTPGACAPVAAGTTVGTVGSTGTGVPHLHFEVRRYVAADGPEASSARVVDPYGWRGAGDDPLAAPGENPRAITQGAPLWIGCGNGRVECGEACDDGNVRGGDCCSASCAFESDGSPCDAGGSVCADERCDGAGACRDVALPRIDCAAPTVPGASRLEMRVGDDPAQSKLRWTWTKGPAISGAAFGSPTTTDGYRLCLYDESATPRVIFGAAAPAGGACPADGSRPCWKGLGKPAGSRGFRYRDSERTPDGIEAVDLKPGAAGKARLGVKAKGGAALTLPALPPGLPLRAQLGGDSGACFEARYFAAGVSASDATMFRATSE